MTTSKGSTVKFNLHSSHKLAHWPLPKRSACSHKRLVFFKCYSFQISLNSPLSPHTHTDLSCTNLPKKRAHNHFLSHLSDLIWFWGAAFYQNMAPTSSGGGIGVQKLITGFRAAATLKRACLSWTEGLHFMQNH